MFLYGGASFQHGATWLSVTRREEICDGDGDRYGRGSDDGRGYGGGKGGGSLRGDRSSDAACRLVTAGGTADLPANLWQQPGVNSWVHPEEMEVEWGYES